MSLFLGIGVTVTLWIKRWQHRNSELTIHANPLVPELICWFFHRADWLLAAWVIGLSLSIPLYRPYPRLTLPWLVGIILLFSRSYGVRPHIERPPPTLEERRQAWIIFGITIGLLLLASWMPIPADSFRFRCWETRSQFREIARDVTADALKVAPGANQKPIQDTQAVLYVYAEPGLFFHLPADGLAVQPARNLDFVDIEATRKLPTFLITGPHAHRSRAFADEFAQRADQFELIASYPYGASDFVRLDEVSATQLRARREPLEVRLFRVK
jgi:dolichyl-phosphate-mannose-protein mannosyltransferase